MRSWKPRLELKKILKMISQFPSSQIALLILEVQKSDLGKSNLDH